ncbi:MAG: DUF4296 domain-containing protein [Chitinophagales bacterium]|nr:DUF4296 domain-containing protein [Chitinophagaceae bacterium]MCB9064513.1 DUF4296 domain-containing protein [Chitinophagales bacterium]
MKKFIAILSIVVFAVSCKPTEETAPIPRDKMTEIVTDIHLAETYSTMVWDSSRMVNKHPDSLASFYHTILEHHSVSIDSFNHSLEWYSAHTTELDSVYNSVISNLSTLEGLQSVGRKSEDD